MADLNALIAQGYQFQAPPDPFANYAKMQQLNQGEQANQLNRMKMQEYQRGMDETNAMRRLDPTSATYLQDITRINPKTGFEFAKMQQEAGTARTEGQIKSTKLIADKLALLPEAYRMADTPEAYLALHRSVHADPVLGPYLQSVGATPEKGLATLQKAVDTGTFEDLRMNSMQSVSQILESMKPQVVAPSASVYQGGKFMQAPAAPAAAAAPTPLAKLQNELAALPPGDPRRAQYIDAIRKETQFAPAASTTIKMAPQESAFESSLGTGQSKKILDSKTAAEDASQILQTNEVGRSLLKSGAITGKGADFLVGLNAGLKQAGIDFGYADAAANSQAYGAAMAANTGNLIKQFGAGTAISDADRAYATKAAAGEITMDETAIRKVLDINDRAARNVIGKHNKSVKGIKTNIPLEVEMPTIAAPQPSGASKIPGSASVAAPLPQAAIDALKAGRGTDAQFDEMFGAGAAKRARGSK